MKFTIKPDILYPLCIDTEDLKSLKRFQDIFPIRWHGSHKDAIDISKLEDIYTLLESVKTKYPEYEKELEIVISLY